MIKSENLMTQLEDIRVNVRNMEGLLKVLSRGAEAEQLYTTEYKEQNCFWEDMSKALQVASAYQELTVSMCDLFHEDLENKINNTSTAQTKREVLIRKIQSISEADTQRLKVFVSALKKENANVREEKGEI